MPVARLNNAQLQASYTDALTVQFAYGRPTFSAQVYNAGAFYQLAIMGPSGRDLIWQADESFTVPALLTFADPAEEGFAPGTVFGGIRFKFSSATAVPQAAVTV